MISRNLIDGGWWPTRIDQVSAVVGVACVLIVGCSSVESPEQVSIDPAERSVSISTTACGDASRTTGAGVAIGDGRILTAAHVVIGAGDVTLHAANDDSDTAATIIRLDPRTDLAVLLVDGFETPAVELTEVDAGDEVTIALPPPSGALVATVRRRVDVRIEEVRSTVRSSRKGYELDVRVHLGDSGAGVFDSLGGLVGVIYGRPLADSPRSFVVSAAEISATLEGSQDTRFECDPSQHRVIDTSMSGG